MISSLMNKKGVISTIASFFCANPLSWWNCVIIPAKHCLPSNIRQVLLAEKQVP